MGTAAAVLLLAALAWLLLRPRNDAQNRYTLTRIDRGDLEAVVSSTGTLSAVTTVQVGTQVSGRIAKIHTDFNRTVRKGDLIALLDTSALQMAVSEAESSYAKAQAQLKQAAQDLERARYLFKENIKTRNDLEQAEVNHDLALATLKSARSGLERARINLGYASIYAPIDGVVISRNVDVGQTVAASLSSPTLFLIANDLQKMQILADVDESDIGQIREGQEARFTVQAQPNRVFSGTVNQIRLEPTTVNNVVSYTVVINVANPDGLLLPGMTATIDFIIGRARNVLRVPNAALRIKPTEQMLASLNDHFADRGNGRSGDASERLRRGSGSSPMGESHFQTPGRNGNRPRDAALIWRLDESGAPKAVRVKTGISDGQQTEIQTDELTEGTEIIKSINLTTEEKSAGGPPRMRIL